MVLGLMTIDEFKLSVSQDIPPPDISPALNALWHDARGDWEAAHRVAQAIRTRPAHGFMRTFIARKGIPAMRPTGIDARASPSPTIRCPKSGVASSQRFSPNWEPEPPYTVLSARLPWASQASRASTGSGRPERSRRVEG